MEHVDVYENKVAGACGALLFALGGGVVYFLLYQMGFISALSGLIGVVLAMKGYAIFAKKESVTGVVISAIMTLLVIVLAWYLCYAKDLYDAYQEWFANGEIDFTITYAEAVQNGYIFFDEPEILSAYVKDLVMSLLFCAVGCFSNVHSAIKAQKAAKARQQEAETPSSMTVEDFAQTEDNPYTQSDDSQPLE